MMINYIKLILLEIFTSLYKTQPPFYDEIKQMIVDIILKRFIEDSSKYYQFLLKMKGVKFGKNCFVNKMESIVCPH